VRRGLSKGNFKIDFGDLAGKERVYQGLKQRQPPTDRVIVSRFLLYWEDNE